MLRTFIILAACFEYEAKNGKSSWVFIETSIANAYSTMVCIVLYPKQRNWVNMRVESMFEPRVRSHSNGRSVFNFSTESGSSVLFNHNNRYENKHTMTMSSLLLWCAALSPRLADTKQNNAHSPVTKRHQNLIK